MEKMLDEKLGVHTRRIAYYMLFQTDSQAKSVLFDQLGDSGEAMVGRWTYPLLKYLLIQGMNITDKGFERSVAAMWMILEEMDRLPREIFMKP